MPLEAEYRLETPENVEVHFELAGPGSRFCAMVIDSLLAWLIIFVLVLLAVLLGAGDAVDSTLSAVNREGPASWAMAVIIVVIYLVFTGYYIFFETVWHGQSPGKRSLNIRAIREDGTPMHLLEILIRNLLRVVDGLPVAYGLGGAVALFHPASKRLGDVAAGTIVVKEGEYDYRAEADRKKIIPTTVATPLPGAAASNPELTAQERLLIDKFMQRRHELLPEARYQLSEKLAIPLFEKHGGHYSHPEDYLYRLREGRHHES